LCELTLGVRFEVKEGLKGVAAQNTAQEGMWKSGWALDDLDLRINRLLISIKFEWTTQIGT
jgi:hypothetical protein